MKDNLNEPRFICTAAEGWEKPNQQPHWLIWIHQTQSRKAGKFCIKVGYHEMSKLKKNPSRTLRLYCTSLITGKFWVNSASSRFVRTSHETWKQRY